MSYYRRQAFKVGAGTVGVIAWAFVSAAAYKITFRDVSWSEVAMLSGWAASLVALTFSLGMVVSGIVFAQERFRSDRQRKAQQQRWEQHKQENREAGQ